ncbi:hypothetical protein NQ317_012757, partial [Molorchus minor]
SPGKTVLTIRLIDVHELSKGQGKLSRSCPNNISINSHKKHGRWNEKMAETGQEEGKQNIRIEGALFDPLDVHWIYLCGLGYPLVVVAVADMGWLKPGKQDTQGPFYLTAAAPPSLVICAVCTSL